MQPGCADQHQFINAVQHIQCFGSANIRRASRIPIRCSHTAQRGAYTSRTDQEMPGQGCHAKRHCRQHDIQQVIPAPKCKIPNNCQRNNQRKQRQITQIQYLFRVPEGCRQLAPSDRLDTACQRSQVRLLPRGDNHDACTAAFHNTAREYHIVGRMTVASG